MAKILAPPAEISQPEHDYANFDFRKIQEADEQYVLAVKAWAKQHGSGEFAGEAIRFPVADNYANYVVLSSKPVKLIHIPLGDAYQFQYANRLTSKDVVEEVKRQRAITSLFSRRV
jgi:hypothetical protein